MGCGTLCNLILHGLEVIHEGRGCVVHSLLALFFDANYNKVHFFFGLRGGLCLKEHD